MYVVDRIFLTWHSPEALAAAMPASMVHWTLLSVPFGVAMYTNTFVSQYDGAHRPDRIAASLWQASTSHWWRCATGGGHSGGRHDLRLGRS
ncbi:MAG: hypothetical protein Ct9H300mP1_20640 [Planctomycetaceae bacterium]|nr:MAG: hypothetical protein Ct9H300mP1_20640 [Planctomycetaceae bacterium]